MKMRRCSELKGFEEGREFPWYVNPRRHNVTIYVTDGNQL